MTATCDKAIRSIRVCAWINIRQAKAARKAGRERMALYHAQVALDCRRDANSLRVSSLITAHTNPQDLRRTL